MKYKHYPLVSAKSEYSKGQKQHYKVTTINWTFAKQDGKKKCKPDYSLVHKNEYIWTLRNLIKFIRATEDVAEDIIEIVRLPRKL